MDLSSYLITPEPYYRAAGKEIQQFAAAHAAGLPVMLKGPTGCGKTRFIEHMAWRIGKPLVTVACHEDMTAADLVGRFLLDSDGTVWHDGPLTIAVLHNAGAALLVLLLTMLNYRLSQPVEKAAEFRASHSPA